MLVHTRCQVPMWHDSGVRGVQAACNEVVAVDVRHCQCCSHHVLQALELHSTHVGSLVAAQQNRDAHQACSVHHVGYTSTQWSDPGSEREHMPHDAWGRVYVLHDGYRPGDGITGSCTSYVDAHGANHIEQLTHAHGHMHTKRWHTHTSRSTITCLCAAHGWSQLLQRIQGPVSVDNRSCGIMVVARHASIMKQAKQVADTSQPSHIDALMTFHPFLSPDPGRVEPSAALAPRLLAHARHGVVVRVLVLAAAVQHP